MASESVQGQPATFSEEAGRVLAHARAAARRLRHDYLGTEHLLLGLMDEPRGLACALLCQMGLQPERVRDAIALLAPAGHAPPDVEFVMAPTLRQTLRLAPEEAHRLGDDEVRSEHLLLAALREGTGHAAVVLKAMGAHLEALRLAIARERASGSDVHVHAGWVARGPFQVLAWLAVAGLVAAVGTVVWWALKTPPGRWLDYAYLLLIPVALIGMALAALGSSRMEAQRGAATVEALVDSWRARRAPARIVEALRMAKSGRVGDGTHMLLETVSRPMPETEYRSALPTLALWLAHDQWTALALRARAELHFRAERVELGITDLTLALERDQSHAEWYQLLGTMLASAGRHDGALDAFRTASRLDPERGEYHAAVASECLRQGDLAGADEASKWAVELSPTDAPLGQVLRGAIAYLRDDLDAAEHAVSQIIERDPAHVGARIVKTAVLLRREQPEQALAEIQEIINEGESPPALIALEGLALTRLGRKQEARAAFASARGRSSDLVDLCARLARALDGEGFGGSASYHRALAALLAG